MLRKDFVADQSTITLFGGHSPLQINDHASRERGTTGAVPRLDNGRIVESQEFPALLGYHVGRLSGAREDVQTRWLVEKRSAPVSYLKRFVARYVNCGLE